MSLAAHKKTFLCLLFLFLPIWLYAQQTVALIPFWGDDDAPIVPFGYILNTSVGRMSEYSPWQVDMNPATLPDDVPPGGYPPYIAPMPSLTKGAPFALTGEVTADPDYYDLWHIRLYLWQMTNPARLIASDEMTAYDEEGCQQFMPGLLDWLFSQIPRDEGPAVATGGQSRVVYYAATEPYKWLYAGFKLGLPIRINSRSDNKDASGDLVRPYVGAISMAAHANVQVFNYFGIQIESNLTIGGSEPFDAPSLMFPALLRYTYYSGTMGISGLGGVYLDIPMGKLKDDFEYSTTVPWGVTAGFTFGNKIGPGFLYLDVRWAMDMREAKRKDLEFANGKDAAFRRHMVTIGIGYEMGFFLKK